MPKQILVQKGFSLIRLFLFVSALVTLFGIALFLLNPAKQAAEENNAKRRIDTMIIANAVAAYILQDPNANQLTLSLKDKEIAKSGVDVCHLLVPAYLTTLPTDPSLNSPEITQLCPNGYSTHYHIVLNEDNTITVSAPDTQKPLMRPIAATRHLRKQ